MLTAGLVKIDGSAADAVVVGAVVLTAEGVELDEPIVALGLVDSLFVTPTPGS